MPVALVTGAGSGIGRATSIALAENGYSLVLWGRRLDELEATAHQIEMRGGQSLIIQGDVSKIDEVSAGFERIDTTFGRLDLLFNNAGMNRPGRFDEITHDDWNTVIATNLTGCFLMAQHAFRRMQAQDPRGGRIINNGSVSAQVPRPQNAAYTAAKHAVTGLTKSISLDGRPFDIACGQIDIGNAATSMATGNAQGALQPDGRVLPEPTISLEDVTKAVLAMATLPLSANVQSMTIIATAMPFVGRG